MQLVQGGAVGGLDGHDVAVVVQARQRLPREVAEALGVARVIVGGAVHRGGSPCNKRARASTHKLETKTNT